MVDRAAACGAVIWLSALGFLKLTQGGDRPALAGAACLLGAIGWTFAVMWALNGKLKATGTASAETVAQLDRWGRLHAIRTLFGLAAFACFAAAAYRAVSA